MRKKLEVLVPYRNRPKHLSEFAPALHEYLSTEGIPFHITIINQADDLTFNRAKLLNVGFLETNENSDYTAFHDVDMLPRKPNAGYHYTEAGRQVFSPTCYNMGGISIVDNAVNWMLNGWSNSFWGWGGSDRNYLHRFTYHGIKLDESKGFRTHRWGKKHFKELKGYHDPARKKTKRLHQKIAKKFKSHPELNDADGLNSCVYKILASSETDYYTILDVDLTE